jgi:DnaD/phage-associated family protein
MAKYRQVHVEFWQDGFVLDLTPEEKYFYIYLMTNSKTTQCGIYELPRRIMETETGYNRETIEKLLNRFVDYGKILYDHTSKEIMIINWMKYNSIKSSKVVACIKKELGNVKTTRFIKHFFTLCKQYEYPIDTLCIDLGEEEEKEEEVEEEKEIEEEVEETSDNTNPLDHDRPDAIMFYQNEIGQIQELEHWINDFKGQEDIVIQAIKIALDRNKKNMGFVKFLLKSWHDNGLKTLVQIQSFESQKVRQMDKNRSVKDTRGDTGDSRSSALLEKVFGKKPKEPQLSDQERKQQEQELREKLERFRGEK